MLNLLSEVSRGYRRSYHRLYKGIIFSLLFIKTIIQRYIERQNMARTYLIWVSARSCPARRMGLILSMSGGALGGVDGGGRFGAGGYMARAFAMEFLAVVRFGGAKIEISSPALAEL